MMPTPRESWISTTGCATMSGWRKPFCRCATGCCSSVKNKQSKHFAPSTVCLNKQRQHVPKHPHHIRFLTGQHPVCSRETRSEERRVGKECRCRWWTIYEDKK